MTFLDLARNRYSLRKYSPRKIPRETIERCLEAARLAPSACNSQPWSFVVVDDETTRKELAEKAFSGMYSMNRFAVEAPVLIVVVTERSKYTARLGGSFRGTQYALMDIGIAGEHLCLQAEEEGIGSCWLGWHNEKAVKRILGIPRSKKVDVIISLGYAAEGVEHREKRRRSLDEIRRYVER